jgi:hypothetical protein
MVAMNIHVNQYPQFAGVRNLACSGRLILISRSGAIALTVRDADAYGDIAGPPAGLLFRA